MIVTMEQVTVGLFIAKKDILRRSERVGGSDAGTVRNGHMTTARTGLRRLSTVLCAALFPKSVHSCISMQLCVINCAPG